MRKGSGFQWLELLTGAGLALLGVYTILRPGKALTGLIMLYGVIALLTGIADILLYVRVERYIGFGPVISLVSGVLSVMSGLMLLVYPDAGKWVLSMLFPIWFLAHCISRLSRMYEIRLRAGDAVYYFTLIMNILGLILGVLMLLRPVLTLLSVGWIVGLYLILQGIDCIILALGGLGSRW